MQTNDVISQAKKEKKSNSFVFSCLVMRCIEVHNPYHSTVAYRKNNTYCIHYHTVNILTVKNTF